MINTFKFMNTTVDGDKFLKYTGNRFEFVTQRPYMSKKAGVSNGVTCTFRILEDKGDYGVDKNTGNPRPTNKGQNFDATILCGKTELPLEYGDIVALEDFDVENSFAINFDLIMRFKGFKKLSGTGGGDNAAQPTR